MVDKNVLAAKYNLQLVAGTFIRVPYSGAATDQLLCYFSRCQRAPFPAPLPGVNDLPSCQPSTEVFDLTIRGPKLSVLSEYGATLELVGEAIRGTRGEGISTGLLTESQAYFGVFNDVRANTVGNLNTTLEGQVGRGWWAGSRDLMLCSHWPDQPRLPDLPEQGRRLQTVLRARRPHAHLPDILRGRAPVHHLQRAG